MNSIFFRPQTYVNDADIKPIYGEHRLAVLSGKRSHRGSSLEHPSSCGDLRLFGFDHHSGFCSLQVLDTEQE